MLRTIKHYLMKHKTFSEGKNKTVQHVYKNAVIHFSTECTVFGAQQYLRFILSYMQVDFKRLKCTMLFLPVPL
jgi:hypothetical protein